MPTVYQHPRALMVKNLRPGLTERGKIKIGIKGAARTSRKGIEFQPPEKLDHFRITTLVRGRDGNYEQDRALHKLFGDKPTQIPVRLLFNDHTLNFQTQYVAFKGKTRWCSGDGEVAQRLNVGEVDCPCERLEFGYDGDDKCKINGKLSVVIDGADVVGGVWTLRTTSINTCEGIASSLALISGMTGGILAGIPLMLTVQPKAATTPEGQATTVYVVGLEFRGSADALRELAHKQALADASYGERMKRVEDDARRLLTPPKVGTVDLEHVEEFYPEAAAEEHGLAREERVEAMAAVPTDDLAEVVDQHGEAFAIAPDALPAWFAERARECGTDEELAALLENNPDDGVAVDAVRDERERRSQVDGPTTAPSSDPLNILTLDTRAAIKTLNDAAGDLSVAGNLEEAGRLIWIYGPPMRERGNGAAKAMAALDEWLLAERKKLAGEAA